MNKQFLEYFRCPPSLVDLCLKGELLPEPGFFRVGSDLTLYGRVSTGQTCRDSTGALDDVSAALRVEQNTCVLPFDLEEVVHNLRRERYDGAMPVVRRSATKPIVRKTSSAMRPFLPTSVLTPLHPATPPCWSRPTLPAPPIHLPFHPLF